MSTMAAFSGGSIPFSGSDHNELRTGSPDSVAVSGGFRINQLYLNGGLVARDVAGAQQDPIKNAYDAVRL